MKTLNRKLELLRHNTTRLTKWENDFVYTVSSANRSNLSKAQLEIIERLFKKYFNE